MRGPLPSLTCIKSVSLVGADDDVCFRMPSTETPKIQEGHEFLGHLICCLIEQGMFEPGTHK